MRKLYGGLIAIAVIAGALFLLTPAKLVNGAAEPVLPDDLDAYLAASERNAADGFELIPGTEKRIHWQVPGERTDYVVIYLHGFSATRQEMAPVAERIADQLGANLFGFGGRSIVGSAGNLVFWHSVLSIGRIWTYPLWPRS